jgi:stage V sporulation protein B
MGRGTLYLMVSNGVFALAGYLIHFGLGRYLGPVDYGIFGVVLSLMTIVNTFFTAGFPQSASKFIAEDNAKIAGIIKSTNRIILVFSALVFSLYFGLAGVIANWFNDSNLTPYIRVSALAIPAYAFYSIYGPGYLNGQRQFGKQAITLFASSIVKIIAVLALVLVGFGVKGAIIGYLIAAMAGFLLAWRFLQPAGKKDVNFGWKKLVEFGIPATAFSVVFFFLMSIDLFAVKAIGGGEAEVGYYTSAATISKVPYFIFVGLAMTLLPSISRSISLNNASLTRDYIQQSIRYMLVLLIPSTVLISATSTGLLALVYSSTYIAAATTLSILIFGLASLSVFFVLANIVIGSGRPQIALGIALPALGIDIGLNILLIPRYGMEGAAWATTATGLTCMCAAVVYVLFRFKTLVSAKSLGKIILASLVIYIIAFKVSIQPVWLPLIYAGLLALYTAILCLLREINKEDLRTFRRIVPLSRFSGIGNSAS